MIVGLWRHRWFILKDAPAELRHRYAGSALGVFWNVVNPLAQILAYKLYRNPRQRIVEWVRFGRVVRHETFWALQGISFGVQRGECLGVIGSMVRARRRR